VTTNGLVFKYIKQWQDNGLATMYKIKCFQSL